MLKKIHTAQKNKQMENIDTKRYLMVMLDLVGRLVDSNGAKSSKLLKCSNKMRSAFVCTLKD